MKHKHLGKDGFRLLSTLTLIAALSSCGNVTAPSFEKLVDFSVGLSSEFYFADGYSNGGLFNCYFRRAAAKIVDGSLEMSLYKEEKGTYAGAEYRSRNSFSYGYYQTRMKAASCSGVISSFFIYTHDPVWDEVDIEFVGKDTTRVQFNYFVDGDGAHEHVHELGFDASKEFHDYGFLWKKDSISWFVDGKKVYEATDNIPTHSGMIMMNIWNCKGFESWSGDFDESKLPVSASYQYIGYSPAK